MAERIMPGLGLRAFYAPGQRDWGANVSEDLRKLSALVQPRALSRSTALPATGAPGDIYLVPPGASAEANALALWDGEPGAEAWVFLTPQQGWQVQVIDEARHVRFDGAAWHPLQPPGIATIRTLAATAHTLEPADTGCILETTGTDPVTVTIPATNAPESPPFETGALVNITQIGSGATTVTAAPGVTLNGVLAGAVALAGPWAGAALTCRGSDAWVIQGALATPVQ